VVGGALLLFRRTTTAGALVLIAVLTNIVTLNFSCDVPVKLFSSHLLLMAVSLRLRLKAVPTSGMLLVTRGFHWVNEYPFNR
jgi:hypothetical protein